MADDRDEHDCEWVTCCSCRCDFALPYELYEAARHSERILFYCPYGHGQFFVLQPPKATEEPTLEGRSDGGNVVSFKRKE